MLSCCYKGISHAIAIRERVYLIFAAATRQVVERMAHLYSVVHEDPIACRRAEDIGRVYRDVRRYLELCAKLCIICAQPHACRMKLEGLGTRLLQTAALQCLIQLSMLCKALY